MKRSYSERSSDALMERYTTRKASRRRFHLIPFLLMVIGAGTVVVLTLRHVVIPILVYFGGTVS